MIEVGRHRVADLLVRIGPDVDNLLVTLFGAHETHLVILVDGVDLGLGIVKNFLLVGRHRRVVHRNGNARERGVMEARLLQTVEDRRNVGEVVAVADVLDQAADFLLVHLVVHERVIVREDVVEDDAADGRLEARASLVLLIGVERGGNLGVLRKANPDLGLQVDVGMSVVRVHGVREVHERATLAREVVASGGQVVHADDHVLRRHGQRTTMGRGFDVVGGKHEHARLGLCLGSQRNVHSHLVTVEVSVERRADERMELDGLAFDEHRLKRLDAQTVQGRCAVQKHGMLDDDFLENVPHVACATIDGTLRSLDVSGVFELDQALHDEGLEQLEGHLLRQAALVQLERRADDDNRTAGVVDALAEQVLAEAALLALEHVGERLQRTVARARDGAAAATVVEEAVDRFLEHALLVVHDDLGGTEVEQALQAVVAVDHATVQIVQVGRREAAAVELHHRAQVGRDDRDDVQDHVGGLVVGLQERVDDLQALDRLRALLALAVGDGVAQLFGGLFEVHRVEQIAHRLGTHAAGEVVLVVHAHLAIERLFGNELLGLDLHEGLEGVLAQLLALDELLVDIGDLGLDLFGGQALVLVDLVDEVVVFRHVVGAQSARRLDEAVALGVELLEVGGKLVTKLVSVLVAAFLVDRSDDGAGEIQHLLQLFRRDVEQVAKAARAALEVPDMGHGRRELDMAHALAANLAAGHFDTAALADDALEANALVLAAGALPVLGRTEDLLAVQAVLFGLERAVVDGLGLLDLAVRPAADIVGAREGDAKRVEVVHVEFGHLLLLSTDKVVGRIVIR